MCYNLTWILAARDNGSTRFAIERISAINKVAFLDKFVPVMVSSSMDVSAYAIRLEKTMKKWSRNPNLTKASISKNGYEQS